MMKAFLVRHRMKLIFAGVAAFHFALLACVNLAITEQPAEDPDRYEILKLVDIEESAPPEPTPDTITIRDQPTASEHVVETDEKVLEIHGDSSGDIDYLPQHKISVIPDIPTQTILSRIEYPPMAMKQGIEGVVYLELFIDESGLIRKISVLKDPGYGFAEAAIAAIVGLRCKPASANGTPVAVRFRYPIRFAIN